MNDVNEKKGSEKSQKSFSQVALNNAAIKVIDELIKLEGSNRLGGSSLTRADVLNDLLIRKGAEKIRDFYYSKS
jgi:hypothetical protein